jgi:NADH:ubiquinone oxidoreductase subunit F (NADH-binding)/(2Fe-2S) ferredoxin
MSAGGAWRALAEAAPRRPRPPLRLIVGAGGCGLARGADAVLGALRREVAARRHPAVVVAGGCNGMCYAQVLVEVQRPGEPRLTYGGVTPESAATLLDHLDEESEVGSRKSEASVSPWLLAPDSWLLTSDFRLLTSSEVPFLAGQHRLLTRDLGAVDPGDIDDYIRLGGYETLAGTLDEMTPEDVVAEVKASNLLGRGGAYFLTAVKWQACRLAEGEPKWLVVNAEEGEPGVYKDRHLLEGDPHRAVEGTLLAAYAVGASRGVFYMNGEARLAQRRVHAALEQARARGLLGDRILGSDFSFEVEVRHGSGGYILGEETALLESVEGNRAMPRVRPPFPVERGLWGKPTVINNVETLATIRTVLDLSGTGFAGLGLPHATGTKLIGLSGNVARPGLVEVPFGTTMRQVVETIGGGVPGGRRLAAVLIGGPSGVFVPAAALDEPIQPRGVVPPGTGGWVVLDDRQSIVGAVRVLTEFNMLESCGKCTPCREGTVRLLDLLDRVEQGVATAADLQGLRELSEVVETASLCGLGQMAPRPILSALQHFEHQFHPAGRAPAAV